MSFLRRVRRYVLPHRDNAFRPHVLRKPYLLALLAVVLAAEGLLMTSLLARELGSPLAAAIVRSDLVALTNSERQSRGVPALAEHDVLAAAAAAKAADMAGRGYFAHASPEGKEPWEWLREAGYDYRYAGENLAVRFVDSGDVVEAWMASPSHAANIVKGVYTETGIGIAQGMYRGQPATYVVQYFGTPAAGSSLVPHSAGAVSAAAAQTPAQLLDTAVRAVVRVLASPQEAVWWILGGVALLLCAALLLTMLHHVQIQPKDALLPAGAVAAVALGFFAFNATYFVPESALGAAAQSAWRTDIGDAASTWR